MNTNRIGINIVHSADTTILVHTFLLRTADSPHHVVIVADKDTETIKSLFTVHHVSAFLFAH